MPTSTFRKAAAAAPLGYLPWEAAGLRWLADARDGALVVEVLEVDERYLDLVRLTTQTPSQADAESFGAALARTHAAGAPAYGSPPDGWHGDGWLGPLGEPLPLQLSPVSSWGQLWAHERIEPMLREGRRRGVYDEADSLLFERLVTRLDRGEFDTPDAPARIHGDLWSGNIMWTERGAVLIDAAAHGGHRETDLAFLQLFGAPHLGAILGAYDDERPLADGWRERVVLHQVHPLMLHAVVYGGDYVEQSLAATRRYA